MVDSIGSRLVALVLVLALGLPGAAFAEPLQTRPASSPVVPQSRGFNVFSPAQDLQLGQQYSAEINKELPILAESNPISQYVRRIGESLVAQLPQHPYQYSFRVVQQKDINAFALPGGPIYVNMGLIEAASNEAEVAGVIGHEIAHVHMRHSTRQASKQVLAQAPLAVLGGVLGGSAMGQLAQMGIGFGLNSAFLKYSRDAESESDNVGTVLMYQAGYNPASAADFFQKLQQQGGARGPQFLSSHPDPGNREASIRKQVATYAARNYRQNSTEFNRIKAEVARTKSYTAQELEQRSQQGQTQGTQTGTMSAPAAADVQPSRRVRAFQHDAYRLTYPNNWQVIGDRSSSVTIAPRGGATEDAVAYGVIINTYQPKSAMSLDNASTQLLQGLQQSNPNMRPAKGFEAVRVNGVNARSVELTGSSPLQGSNGKPLGEREWLVVLPRGSEQFLYAVFVAPAPDYGKLKPEFERMLRSLRIER